MYTAYGCIRFLHHHIHVYWFGNINMMSVTEKSKLSYKTPSSDVSLIDTVETVGSQTTLNLNGFIGVLCEITS